MTQSNQSYETPTSLNADFSKPVIIDTEQLDWLPSPSPGVERRMLDRRGGEVARATSLVRYAPNSQFSSHLHQAGEEFYVLEGTFCDEHGAYPVGTYIRNPPGSQHSPFTDEGCIIFVKLRQMKAEERQRVVCITEEVPWKATSNPGHARKQLFASTLDDELVTMHRLSAGCEVNPGSAGRGQEILVIDGSLTCADQRHGPGSWLRLPAQTAASWRTDTGCILWVKRGSMNGE